MTSEWNWVSPSGLVAISNNQLKGEMTSTAEVKLAMKELRMLKKHLGLEKKQVNSELQLIRSQHSQSNKRRGSMPRGGGGFGRFMRTMNQMGRDWERSKQADSIEPYLAARAILDARISMVDQALLQLEVALHKAEVEEVDQKKAMTNAPPSPKTLPGGKNFCGQCGAPTSQHVRFCGQCGSRLD